MSSLRLGLVAYPSPSLNFSDCATSLEWLSSGPLLSRSISGVAQSSDQPGMPRIETPPHAGSLPPSGVQQPPLLWGKPLLTGETRPPGMSRGRVVNSHATPP